MSLKQKFRYLFDFHENSFDIWREACGSRICDTPSRVLAINYRFTLLFDVGTGF